MRRAAVLALLVCALAGCGDSVEVRESDLRVEKGLAAAPVDQDQSEPSGGGPVRIAVVTHGQPSNPFWTVVRNGIDAAAREVGVSASYRAPDTFSVSRMATLIDDAVKSRPDGLVVSIPSAELVGAVRRAVTAGIPVVSVNSGSELFRPLGVLVHVGQPEERAGLEAGRRLAALGVRRGVCVNHEERNVGLAQRCRGFVRALRRAGGQGRVLRVSLADPGAAQEAIQRAMASGRVDGLITLSVVAARAALGAAAAEPGARDVQLATFDLSPEVLDAVRTRRMRFAVDQQAYLQGYLPIVTLAKLARYGLLPAEGDVIPTGPRFVTRENAGEAIRLSRQGIR